MLFWLCLTKMLPNTRCSTATLFRYVGWIPDTFHVYFKHKAFRTGIGVTFYRLLGDKAATDATCCLRGPCLQSVNNTLEPDSQTAFPDLGDKNQEHCSRVTFSTLPDRENLIESVSALWSLCWYKILPVIHAATIWAKLCSLNDFKFKIHNSTWSNLLNLENPFLYRASATSSLIFSKILSLFIHICKSEMHVIYSI